MPRKPHTPKLCHHKATGQAYVTIDGRERYLGLHGTPAAEEAYNRLLGEWFASGRTLAPSTPKPPLPAGAFQDYTVEELCARFWLHAEKHYRRPDGTPTGELPPFRAAIKPLRKLYGSTQVRDFGPLALKAVRQAMIDAKWKRKTINRQVARVRQVFRWGVAEQLVPPTVITALAAVGALAEGRSDAEEAEPVLPATESDIQAVKPFLSRQVWGMIQLQLHTGMRPGEVCKMRMQDLDMSGEVWRYTPARHKTSHRGKYRIVPLGPQAKAVLQQFQKAKTDAYLFDPSEAEAERNALKLKHPELAAKRRSEHPRRQPGPRYTVDSYRRAIGRACRKADAVAKKEMVKAGQEAPATPIMPSWHPHQLRHNYATKIRKLLGIEAAKVMLGHSKIETSLIYAEKDASAAESIAAKVG